MSGVDVPRVCPLCKRQLPLGAFTHNCPERQAADERIEIAGILSYGKIQQLEAHGFRVVRTDDMERDWENGYDQGVAEVLSEMVPQDRHRAFAKFRAWGDAWRKWRGSAGRARVVRDASDCLAGITYVGPGGEGGER